jgi:hypothetical protein
MNTLAELGWKVGDLGRFQMEGKKHPRFEVLGENPGGAIIWYAGEARPQIVPFSTFKAQCVNHWVIDVIPTIPQWIKPNVVFNLDDKAARVLQAEVSIQYSRTLQVADLRGKDLKVRRIRLDHVSCMLEVERLLVLIPLKIVIESGFIVQSCLDVLLSDEFEDHDEVEDLLKNL